MNYSPLRIPKRFANIGWLIVLLFAAGGNSNSVVADETEQQFLSALRERRFFELAELHCQRELDRPGLNEQDRSLFLLEFSKTLAAHAAHASSDEQPELWQRAADVLKVAVQENSAPLPRHGWLMAQRAFVMAQRAESLRDQRSLAASVSEQTVLDAIQAAVRELDFQISEYTDRNHAHLADLNAAEKRQLVRGLQFMQARMFVSRARLHVPTNPDFSEALLAADKVLKPLAVRPSETPLAWKARTLQVTIARLRDQFSVAERLLKNLESDAPPADTEQVILNEQMHLALNRDKPDAALNLLINKRKKTPNFNPGGEALFLKVRAIHVLREQAYELKQTELAEKLSAQQQSVLEELRLRHGGFWLARAQVFVKQAAESLSFGPEVAQFIQRAREDFSVGNFDGAIAGYQRAAKQTAKTGRTQLAAEFAFTAASIALDRQMYEPAARQFDELFSTWPDSDRAERAHLLFAWCRGRIYAVQRTAGNRKAYSDALQQHRQRYPDSESQHDAVMMLAELEEQRLQFSKALPLFESVPADHARFADAQLGIVRCGQAIMNRLQKIQLQSEQRAAWESRVSSSSANVVKAIEKFNEEQQRIARIGLADILLNQSQPKYELADNLLKLCRQLGVTDEDSLEASAAGVAASAQVTMLRIISSSGIGDFRTAHAMLKLRLDEVRLEELDRRLARIPNTNPDAPILKLRLAVLDQAVARSATPAARSQLEIRRTKLLAETGRLNEAMQKYRDQLQANPRSLNPRRELARLLEQAGSKKHLAESRAEWQRVEKLLRGGTPAWCEARFHVARLSLKLGKADECKKLIQVTRLLYPDFGSPEWKTRFEELDSQASG